MIVEQTSVRGSHECVKVVETQFVEDPSGDCGTGILDRKTSENEGRVTSEGECRIIA